MHTAYLYRISYGGKGFSHIDTFTAEDAERLKSYTLEAVSEHYLPTAPDDERYAAVDAESGDVIWARTVKTAKMLA